jgi:retron-type reverse transcriptase
LRGRSIRTGAEHHVGKPVLVHLDLKDFFPSVHFARIRGLLIAVGYGYEVATSLAVLMTEAERQPVEVNGSLYHVPVGPRYCVQGAPTSPGLCNAVALRMDRRLSGVARRFGCAYTRYADDITFSFNEGGDHSAKQVIGLCSLASRIIREEGFSVNKNKTRIMRSGQRQTVTGVTVNRVLGLSRKERRRVRAAVHQLQRRKADGETDRVRRHLRGKIAYVNMLNPDQAKPLHASL